MDVHLVIADFSMHQKGFSVQRWEAAVRESLPREFGAAIPFLFYAPTWVAQYIPSHHHIEIAGGGYDVARLVKERILRVRADHPNGARVIVASYNHYVRVAALDAGKLNG